MPRLGKVGEFELTLSNKIILHIEGIDDSERVCEAKAVSDESSIQVRQGSQVVAVADPTSVQVLKSLRMAAWAIFLLLLIIVFK